MLGPTKRRCRGRADGSPEGKNGRERRSFSLAAPGNLIDCPLCIKGDGGAVSGEKMNIC